MENYLCCLPIRQETSGAATMEVRKHSASSIDLVVVSLLGNSLSWGSSDRNMAIQVHERPAPQRLDMPSLA